MNSTKLTDLDELSLTVRDRESSLYIGEAINAYRGGAFRASIISTWVAVVTDIISKLRELASQGDANASTQISSIDTAIQNNNVPQLQKIENELLEKARNDFEFLSQQEFTDLERLKQDRNLCAHPAFVTEGLLFQPQPEIVRAHIVHAILHLLQHKPVQGKSALNRINADIIRSSFPADQENVNKLLGAKYLNRAKDSFEIPLLPHHLKPDNISIIPLHIGIQNPSYKHPLFSLLPSSNLRLHSSRSIRKPYSVSLRQLYLQFVAVKHIHR